MGIIRRSYSTEFYFWPIDKEKRHDSILKWEVVRGEPVVVFHPFLSFDPLTNLERQTGMLARDGYILDWQINGLYDNLKGIYDPGEDRVTPIVHEEIKADFNFFQGLDSFLGKIERNFKLKADQWLWNDTGYWTAMDSKYGYMGLSEESAIRIWNNNKDIRLCYIVSNPSTILEFYLDKREENIFSLNVYYTNTFVVFPDLIEAVHRALDEVGNWKTIKIENKDHDVILASDYKNKRSMKREDIITFSISPKRVMPIGNDPNPGTDFLYAVIVENTFFNIEERVKKPDGYAILIRGGGWLREDFQEEKKYQISFSEVRKLENCYLVQLAVKEIAQDDDNLGFLHQH